jgi:hypothetical protein
MAVGDFSEEDALEFEKAIELDFAVLGDHDQVLVVV